MQGKLRPHAGLDWKAEYIFVGWVGNKGKHMSKPHLRKHRRVGVPGGCEHRTGDKVRGQAEPDKVQTGHNRNRKHKRDDNILEPSLYYATGIQLPGYCHADFKEE